MDKSMEDGRERGMEGWRDRLREGGKEGCRQAVTAGTRSEETYGHIMMGDGPTPRERKRERVTCGDSGREMAAGSLDSHRMNQHGKARERKWAWTDAATGGGEGEEQQTYRMGDSLTGWG